MLVYSSSLRLLSQKAKSKYFLNASKYWVRSLYVSSSTSSTDTNSSTLLPSDSITLDSISMKTSKDSLSSLPISSISQKFIESFKVKEAIESSHNNLNKKNLLSTARIPKLNTSINHYIKYKSYYEGNEFFNEERFKDQIDLEVFQFNSALHERQNITNTMLTMGKASDMKFISKHVLVWTKFLIQVIEKELEQFYKGESSIDRNVYGYSLTLLAPEKVALITLNTLISNIFKNGNQGSTIAHSSLELANHLQMEVHYNRLNQGNANLDKITANFYKKNSENIPKIYQKLLSISNLNAWPIEDKVKLGTFLIHKTIECVKNEKGNPIFFIEKDPVISQNSFKRSNILRVTDSFYSNISSLKSSSISSSVRYLPMLVPPKKWNNRDYFGGYYFLQATLMRHNSNLQVEAVKRADIPHVLEALDYVGSTPWIINHNIYNVLKDLTERKTVVGEIPPYENEEIINMEQYKEINIGTVTREFEKFMGLYEKKYNKILESNSEVNMVPPPSKSSFEYESFFNSFLEKDYKNYINRVNKVNAESHSLRSDLSIKLDIATKYLNETFFFPHNMDFRGRAYPIPPNLSHLGSDLSRSLLVFKEKKKIGENGLRWLKIHLASLFGNNKIDFDERCDWVDNNYELLVDSVKKPLDGSMWWKEAESPFQALACMHEIHNAIELGKKKFYEKFNSEITELNCNDIVKHNEKIENFPSFAFKRPLLKPQLLSNGEVDFRTIDASDYESNFPVHQDGSCNGLQHYAGLGRDYDGAVAVNLVDSDSPQDVYSKVLDIVKLKLQKDSKYNLEEYIKEKKIALKNQKKMSRLVCEKLIKSNKDINNFPDDPSDFPLDCEIEINESILQNIEFKSKLAELLCKVASRKIIKQTVMTSVYGVTEMGARAQVQNRLEEYFDVNESDLHQLIMNNSDIKNRAIEDLGLNKDIQEKNIENNISLSYQEKSNIINISSKYLAHTTLESLNEIFDNANVIMNWLSNLSNLVAKDSQPMSWITPLGLPVVQPYRAERTYTVKTVLQHVVLSLNSDYLPVSLRKQTSAFPPNFVHSLDASHMYITCLRMKDAKKTFVSVHDSYWTHPSDVDLLRHLIRESFVELYSYPILETLHESVSLRFPLVDFPVVPGRGSLEIEEVNKSKFFFH